MSRAKLKYCSSATLVTECMATQRSVLDAQNEEMQNTYECLFLIAVLSTVL
jgi:hypothetical protein